MKFTIPKNDLMKLITKIQNIVPSNPTIPVLGNILIEAVNDELILTATDLTVGMRCFTRAKIHEEGSTALPAKTFLTLVRELPNVNIDVATTSHGMTEFVAGPADFKLCGISKEDFPSLPEFSKTDRLAISQKALKEALYKTSFAVSKDDTRYILQGLSLQIENNSAVFVGSDGKRLARFTIPLQQAESLPKKIVIPPKAFEETQKILSDNGDANLYFMPDKLLIEADGSILITKLISGDYPDFSVLIPEKTNFTIHLHREELMTCLRQVALFTTELSQSVRFNFENGELSFAANLKELGGGITSIPVDFSGDPFPIALNPIYFLDILRHCKDDTIKLSLTDSYNPGIITDSSNALFIIMPMRLYQE